MLGTEQVRIQLLCKVILYLINEIVVLLSVNQGLQRQLYQTNRIKIYQQSQVEAINGLDNSSKQLRKSKTDNYCDNANNYIFMSFLPNQTLAGQIIAIAGLTLAPLTTLLGRHYSRTIYFAQLLFLFSAIFNSTAASNFSINLGYSWLSFMPSFTTNYCTAGDFSCSYGYLISPALCWVGGAVLLFLLVKIIACKVKTLRFLKVYAFYRGFAYWFFIPLTYFSTLKIISGVQTTKYDTTFISAAIVLAVLIVIGLVELISAKCAQREQQNIWRKWIEFLSHLNIWSMAVLVAIYKSYSTDAIKYLLNIPLAIYFIIFIIKYKFLYKVVERISVFLQDAIIITVYNIFVIKYAYIAEYNLDFFGIAIVGCLELFFLVPKLVHFFKSDDDEVNSSINPEKELRQSPNKKSFAEAQFMPNDSIEGLRYSQVNAPVSPKRSPVPPRRR